MVSSDNCLLMNQVTDVVHKKDVVDGEWSALSSDHFPLSMKIVIYVRCYGCVIETCSSYGEE